MGISRYPGDVLSVPNLFKNGGLDFQDTASPLPPFYSINGALKPGDASPVENSWSQVFGETPEEAGAPSNYFRIILPSETPVTVAQDMISAKGGVLDHVVPCDPFELAPHAYKAVEANLLYQGEFTISFDVRVVQGEVRVGYSFTRGDNDEETEDEYTEIDATYSAQTWRRFTGVFDPGEKRLAVVGAQITRRGVIPAVEVHVGNIMLAQGAYDALPYTGDPSAMIFPRGAIIMAMGVTCPPGFVEYDVGRVFPKEGDPGLEGGSRHHEHEISQSMLPEEGWPRRSLLSSEDSADIVGLEADAEGRADPADDHEHEIEGDLGDNNSEPNSRTYVLCRRV